MKHFLNIFEDLEGAYKAANSCCAVPRNQSRGISLSEDENKFYIDVLLPGVKPEEVEVTLDPKEQKLTVRGEAKDGRENVKYHLKGANSFFYEVPLTNDVDFDAAVQAVAKDGVLMVSLSKTKSQKPVKIDVRVA